MHKVAPWWTYFVKFLKGILVSSCNLAAVSMIFPTFLKIWMNHIIGLIAQIYSWKANIRNVQKFIHMDSTTQVCDEHSNENVPWQKYWLTYNFRRKHDESWMWCGNKHSTLNCLFIENYMLTEILPREILSSVFGTGSCGEVCRYKFPDILYTGIYENVYNHVWR
jgi:hypothetical protein